MIIDVRPRHLAIDVEPTTAIRAQFAKSGYAPLALESITSDSVYLASFDIPIPASLELMDNGYRIHITPLQPLQPGANYKVTIVGDLNHDGISEGIHDIHNNPMPGVYNWWFTTSGVAAARPTLISPANNTITHEPMLSWSSVEEAVNYEIHLDTVGTFANPQVFTTPDTTLQPNIDLGGLYYWRVRARVESVLDSTPTTPYEDLEDGEWYSPWSAIWHFRYDEVGAPIEDEPDPFMVKETHPVSGAVNLTNLEKAQVTFNKPVDLTTLLDSPIYIIKRTNL